MKNKLAVSLMISYVLLISIVLIISVGVFIWLKLEADVSPAVDCKADTSIIIENYACNFPVGVDPDDPAFNPDLEVNFPKELKLSLKNNGRFTIDGIIVIVGEDPIENPSTYLLPEEFGGKLEGHYVFKTSLKPQESITANFLNLLKDNTPEDTLDNPSYNPRNIRRIEIQPFIIKDSEKIVCRNAIKKIPVEDCTIAGDYYGAGDTTGDPGDTPTGGPGDTNGGGDDPTGDPVITKTCIELDQLIATFISTHNIDEGFGSCNTEFYDARLDVNKDGRITQADRVETQSNTDAQCSEDYADTVLSSCNLVTCNGEGGDGNSLLEISNNFFSENGLDDTSIWNGCSNPIYQSGIHFDLNKDKNLNDADKELITQIIDWEIEINGVLTPVSTARKNYECSLLYNFNDPCNPASPDFMTCEALSIATLDFMNLHSNKDDGFGACNTEVYTARLDFNKDSHISPIDAISSINALNMGGKDAICNAHYQNNILWSCNLATCVGTNGDGVNLGSLIINYRNNPEYEDIRCQSGYNFRFDVDKDQEINNDDEDIIAGIVNWDVDGSGNPISNARKNYECNQLYQNPLNRCEGDAADFVDCFQLAEFIDDFLSIHGSGIECDNTVYEARLDVNKDGFIVPIDALIPRNTFNLGGNEANSNAICNAYYQNNEYECRL